MCPKVLKCWGSARKTDMPKQINYTTEIIWMKEMWINCRGTPGKEPPWVDLQLRDTALSWGSEEKNSHHGGWTGSVPSKERKRKGEKIKRKQEKRKGFLLLSVSATHFWSTLLADVLSGQSYPSAGFRRLHQFDCKELGSSVQAMPTPEGARRAAKDSQDSAALLQLTGVEGHRGFTLASVSKFT